MDNMIFANGFEDFMKGSSVCPEKIVEVTGLVNPEFVAWHSQDHMILSWIYSSLTPKIIALIICHTTSYSTWIILEKIFLSSS